MNVRVLTIGIMAGATVGLTIWDIIATRCPNDDNTISELMAESASHTSVIPAAFGFLGGHFFGSKENAQLSLGRSLGALAAAIGSDVLLRDRKPSQRPWRPMAALLAGIAAGYWAWPQKPR